MVESEMIGGYMIGSEMIGSDMIENWLYQVRIKFDFHRMNSLEQHSLKLELDIQKCKKFNKFIREEKFQRKRELFFVVDNFIR